MVRRKKKKRKTKGTAVSSKEWQTIYAEKGKEARAKY